MLKINSKKIVEVLGSVSTVVDEEIDNITTDSRYVNRGDLFFALRGDKFDGHSFVKQVIEKGGVLAVVDRLIPDVPAVRQILVEDTTKALGRLGAYIRSQYKGKVIALTGSSGKTTLKEELRFVLKRFAPISATEKNFNNHIGVPKTLCDLSMNSDYAIIEMGMSAKGELSYLTSITKPDIAIVNNVYPMHIEFFKDGLEGIAKAKAEIFEGIDDKGFALFNADTNFAEILEKKAKKSKASLVEFGKKNVLSIEETDAGLQVKAKIGNQDVSYELSSKGEHNVYNSLCVLSVVSILGLDVQKAAGYLKDFAELEGRGKRSILKLANGGSFTLIDDSYSGQPEAMKIAISGLSNTKTTGKRVAIIGKMGELGDFSKEKHIEVGQALSASKVDVVIGVCEETKDVLAQLPSKIEQHFFENYEGVSELLINKLLQNNDVLLIKGSHYGSQVYKIAEALIKQGAN